MCRQTFGNHLLLVQERAALGSLAHRLYGLGNSGPLPVSDLVQLAVDVARGLAFTHSQGVAHNDVKSANILLSASGAAVSADSGLAQLVKTIYPCTFAFNNSVVGGTSQRALNWTAPENFDGSSDGHGKPAADVYSFGMVLYEMAAGKVPWLQEKENTAIAAAVASGRRPAILQTCAPWLAELIKQCWRQNFTDRPTMATVLLDLVASLF